MHQGSLVTGLNWKRRRETRRNRRLQYHRRRKLGSAFPGRGKSSGCWSLGSCCLSWACLLLLSTPRSHQVSSRERIMTWTVRPDACAAMPSRLVRRRFFASTVTRKSPPGLSRNAACIRHSWHNRKLRACAAIQSTTALTSVCCTGIPHQQSSITP